MGHLEAFARKEAFASVLSIFITNISTGDNPSSTADCLASVALMALLKKNEEETQVLRELIGPDFVLPIRPLAMVCGLCEAGL